MDEEIEKDADEDGFADADIMSFRPTIYNDDELEKSVLQYKNHYGRESNQLMIEEEEKIDGSKRPSLVDC